MRSRGCSWYNCYTGPLQPTSITRLSVGQWAALQQSLPCRWLAQGKCSPLKYCSAGFYNIISIYEDNFSLLEHFFLTHIKNDIFTEKEHASWHPILRKNGDVLLCGWICSLRELWACKYSTSLGYMNIHITHTHTQTHRVVGFFLTFHTGGSGSGGASDLPRETGTLDGLRALFNLILITAAMDGHHLTCPLLHLVRDWETEKEKGEVRGIIC